MSVVHIMSGVMKPLHTLLGVIKRRSVSRRTLMFPSFEAVYPRAYMRRPTSTMSARSEVSVLMRGGRGICLGRSRSRNETAAVRSTTSPLDPEARTCRTLDRAPSGRYAAPRPRPAAVRRPRPKIRARDAPPPGRTGSAARHTERTEPSRTWSRRSIACRRVRGLQGIEGPFRLLCLRAVGCNLHDLGPRLLRAGEILLAIGPDDAEVQERLRVLRVEFQRLRELVQRFVRLV